MGTTSQGTDRFKVLATLGQGGMGVVYRALDRSTGRQVALKTTNRPGPGALYTLKREFRTRAEVRHENLVSLYDLVIEGEHCFFTMELVDDAVDLLEWITGEPSDGPLPGDTISVGAVTAGPDPEVLVRLRDGIGQLLQGLKALHGRDIVHRDVKPANVLVTPEGRVVLSDFGLASTGTDLEPSRSGEITGSIPYMAPEQAAAAAPTPAADLYAVGVIIFEVLCGRRPFVGHAMKILADKSRRDAPPVRSVEPAVPKDIADLADALLRRMPEDRPTAEEARQVLLGGQTVEEPLLDRTVMMAPVAAFIGRNAELAQLRQLASHRTGHRTALISGPSGMGKSHLVRHFANELRNDGWWVLRGRCHPAESIPFKALDGIVDALSHHLATLRPRFQREVAPRHTGALFTLFPVLERVVGLAEAPRPRLPADPVLVQHLGFSALRDLLARLAERRPLAVWIDDLQWGDIDSLPLLRELQRDPDPPPLLLLLSFRAEDRDTSPLLKGFLDDPRGSRSETIVVGPLSLADSEQLASGLLDQLLTGGPGAASEIARQAGGSPFLIGEMARFVRHDEDRSGPGLLHHAVAGRLDEVGGVPRKLLEVVAVAGQPLEEWTAWTASSAGSAGAGAVRELGQASLLRVSEGPSGRLLDAYHDKIRETLLDRIPASRLVAVHASIAHAMSTEEDPDPEALLTHWLGAGDLGRAGSAALRAAHRAEEQLAFERAAALYAQCIELNPAEPPSWELRDGRARSLANAGLGLEAADEWEAAAADLQVVQSGADDLLRLRSLACEFRLRWMDLRGAGAPLREVLRAVRIRVPSSTLGRILAGLLLRGWVRLRGMPYDASKNTATPEQKRELEALWRVFRILSLINPLLSDVLGLRYVLRALPTGDPSALARAFCQEVGYGSMLGSERYLRGVEARLATLDELAELSGDPHDKALVHINSGVVGMCTSQWRRLAETAERAATLWETECIGEQWYVALGRSWSVLGYTYLGELRIARSMIEVGVAEAVRRDDQWAKANYWLGEATISLLAVGHVDRVRELLVDARRTLGPQDAGWVQSAYNVQSLSLVASEVLLDLWEGDATGAWHRLSGEWAALRRSGYLLCRFIREWARFRLGGAALAASAGNGPSAVLQRRTAARQSKALARDTGRMGEPMAELLRGALAFQKDRTDLALIHLRRAEGLFEALEMKAFLAASRLRIRQLGQDEEAGAAADAWFESEGVVHRDRFAAAMAPGYD